MENKGAEQQRRDAVSGDSQCEKRNHGRTLYRIVGALCRRNALKAAFPELLRVLGITFYFIVTHKLRDTAADTGKCSDEGGNDGGSETGRKDGNHFLFRQPFFIDLRLVSHLSSRKDIISGFQDNLRQSNQSNHGRKNGNPIVQRLDPKGIPAYAGHSVCPDATDKDSE